MMYPYLRGQMMTLGTVLLGLLITKSCMCQQVLRLTDAAGEVTAPISIIKKTLITTTEQTATSSTFRSTSATQEAPPLLITPPVACGDCYIAMGTSSDTFQAVTDIVLTAYSITSAYVSDGVCITTSEVPITLNTAYTITSPTSVPSSEFPAIAGSKFVEFLGFSNCVGSGEELFPTPIIPTTFSILVPAPSASLPASANSTTSPTLHPSNATERTAAPGLDEPERIGIDVVVSSAGLILVFLVASIWRKRRLRAAAIAAGEQGNTEDGQQGTSASGADSQPYLQQKSELETEERRRHELEGRQKIHELDDQTGIFEIPAGTHEHRLAVMQTRQELKGGEHSQELGT